MTPKQDADGDGAQRQQGERQALRQREPSLRDLRLVRAVQALTTAIMAAVSNNAEWATSRPKVCVGPLVFQISQPAPSSA